MTSHVLLCVWPVTLDRDYSRDELVEQAVDDVDRIAGDNGARVAGAVTFRVIDEPAELEGWEHWPGWLLIATAQAVPLARTATIAA
jgi:hypothetical protein